MLRRMQLRIIGTPACLAPPLPVRAASTGVGGDHGIDHNKNWLRSPYVFILPVP
jgi:hypothetical protein